jgi:hypothetical protein
MGISNNMQLTTHEHPMSEVAPDLTERLTGPPRLRFWEIDDSFKCPVVGWCLDMAEQREILRKEGICVKGKSDFEAHTLLVDSPVGGRSFHRKKLEKLVDIKPPLFFILRGDLCNKFLWGE